MKRSWHMLVFKLTVLVGAAAVSSASCGSEPVIASAVRARMAQVDQFIQAEMQREKVPGLALGIVVGNDVIAAKGYGYANVEHSVPVTDETIFEAGSIGKALTAMAAMLEVEDGKIALDDPITKYFPGAPDWWSSITVRQLMNHTSGIPDYAEPEAHVQLDGKPPYDWQRNYSDDELVKIAYRLPMDFPSGTQWIYNNTAYVLMGVLLNRVSGHFYGDLLADRIFQPLGMKTARIISEADIVKNRAAGYRLVNGELKNQEWVSPQMNTTADGSVYLSVRDFIAWDRGLRAQAILKPASWAEIYKPAALKNGGQHPYGLGWYLRSARGKPWYQHCGAWQGFRACFSRYLADDLTIIVETNLAEANPAHMVNGIADLIDPELPEIPHKQ